MAYTNGPDLAALESSCLCVPTPSLMWLSRYQAANLCGMDSLCFYLTVATEKDRAIYYRSFQK